MAVTFNPKDRNTSNFLKQIGVPPEIIKKSRIEDSEMTQYNISETTLDTAAMLDFSKTNNDENNRISPEEARLLNKIIKTQGNKMLILFDSRMCPGSGSSTGEILQRMAGQTPARTFNSALVEKKCPSSSYQNQYNLEQLIGIHFTDAQMPPKMSSLGRAVMLVKIAGGGRGSAVQISPDGKVMTAYHVIFDEDGKIRKGLVLMDNNNEIAITENNVVGTDKEHDVVTLHVRGLDSSHWIPVSKRPPLPGEPITMIGFPKTAYEQAFRTYTLGRTTDYDMNYVTTDAWGTFGNSGGPIINTNYELVGVGTSGKLNKGLKITASPKSTTGFLPCNFINHSEESLVSMIWQRQQEIGKNGKKDFIEYYNKLKKDLIKINPKLFEDNCPRSEKIAFENALSILFEKNISLDELPEIYEQQRGLKKD